MNEERPQLRKPYQKTAIQPEAEPTGGFIHSGQMKKEGESGMSAFEKELKQIARTAGNMFSTHKMSAVDQKEGHANFVTNIDREVEDYLQSQLLALVPGSKMIGEEQENESLSDNPTAISQSGLHKHAVRFIIRRKDGYSQSFSFQLNFP